MSFNKRTIFTIDKDSIEVIDSELIKTAAFKLPDGVNYDPDFLYMWVKAVSSGETWGANKNSDWFPREELKKSFNTFLSAHMFKNHENKQIENAIGDVLKAVWDDIMDCVKLLVRVDSKIAPSIVRGFKSGYMTDVSMGCRVDHSVCSICGNVAKTPREYCDHIKFERGKVYEDGRKVYEINIGPKFHDISAVLNGAERSAKVTGIYIVDGKIAACEDNEGMEKAASCNDFSHAFDEIPNEIDKTASWEDSYELFPESLMDKKAYAHKIAALRKDFDGKILSMSDYEADEELASHADEARDALRLCYEDYWDDEKCEEIANKLSNLADERGESKEAVFGQFLNALTFTGCELAPREFACIFEKFFNVSCDGDKTYTYCDDDENTMSESCARVPGFLGMESMLGPAILAIKSGMTSVPSDFKSPARGIAIMGTMPPEHNHFDDNLTPDIVDMFSDAFKSRTVSSPRVIRKITVSVKPHRRMFTTHAGSVASDVLNALYMAYQNDRVKNFMSPKYIKVAEYFADEMEKSAGALHAFRPSPLTSATATVGLPLMLGYSKLQRSRINKGENVSALNDYIAKNPGSAYVVATILSGPAYRGYAGITGKAGNVASKAARILGKKADQNNDNMEKNASLMTDKQSKVVDDAVFSVYNKDNQVEILKMASILLEDKKDDVADYILNRNNLNQSDVDNFINIAKTALAQDEIKSLQKIASDISKLTVDVCPENVSLERVLLSKFCK